MTTKSTKFSTIRGNCKLKTTSRWTYFECSCSLGVTAMRWPAMQQSRPPLCSRLHSLSEQIKLLKRNFTQFDEKPAPIHYEEIMWYTTRVILCCLHELDRQSRPPVILQQARAAQDGSLPSPPPTTNPSICVSSRISPVSSLSEATTAVAETWDPPLLVPAHPTSQQLLANASAMSQSAPLFRASLPPFRLVPSPTHQGCHVRSLA